MADADKVRISPGPLVAAMPWARPNEMSFSPRFGRCEDELARVMVWASMTLS
jgi:hypothetical protein